ncbi:MAG: LPS export ABC transporter ATP-binding protein [Opitutales bacterium]|nr:LPS export ABC transporter ATP-binding protein [Opitutales bacterium]MDG1325056.1 LPS export ABC transporter ATP-binding protein [Opitutales bacterium]
MNIEKQVPSLRVEGLRKKFGGKEVVCGVDLEAKGGEVVGLLGPNGAGKTTTFSMVAGFLTPSSGKVLLNNDDLTRLPAYKRARKGIVYLPQESSVFRKLTVEDNIRAIAETLSISKGEQDQLVKVRLEELNLTHLSKQKAYTLSGGERRRLEITRALTLSPQFLLLDEPFSGVDPISVSEVTKIILDLKKQGIGIFLTDHNVRETLRAVDRAYLLYDGSVLTHGDAPFLLSDSQAREKYLGTDFQV